MTPEDSSSLPQTEAFIDDLQIPWPVGYGASGMMDALQVVGFPTKFVVGADGVLLWAGHPTSGLDDAIEQALAAAGQ